MGSTDQFLIVGARGFIGAWICRLLVEEGVGVTALDAAPDPRSANAVLSEEHLKSIRFVVADARNAEDIDAAIGSQISHVVYLAGLLRPASENNPLLSAQVSICGLINVLDAAVRRKGSLKIAYASTGAIYGPGSQYPGKQVTAASLPIHTAHYGFHRYVMEQTADLYFRQHNLPSIGLRPWVVYGAGRFNGHTAQPSIAMLAAAANSPFKIAYGGRSIFHHVRDVAAGFIRGVRAPLSIALAANIPGESVSIGELIEMIYAHAPNAVGKLSYDMREPDAVEFLDDPTLETLIGPLRSPTFERVGETIHEFRSLLAASRITFP